MAPKRARTEESSSTAEAPALEPDVVMQPATEPEAAAAQPGGKVVGPCHDDLQPGSTDVHMIGQEVNHVNRTIKVEDWQPATTTFCGLVEEPAEVKKEDGTVYTPGKRFGLYCTPPSATANGETMFVQLEGTIHNMFGIDFSYGKWYIRIDVSDAVADKFNQFDDAVLQHILKDPGTFWEQDGLDESTEVLKSRYKKLIRRSEKFDKIKGPNGKEIKKRKDPREWWPSSISFSVSDPAKLPIVVAADPNNTKADFGKHLNGFKCKIVARAGFGYFQGASRGTTWYAHKLMLLDPPAPRTVRDADFI